MLASYFPYTCFAYMLLLTKKLLQSQALLLQKSRVFRRLLFLYNYEQIRSHYFTFSSPTLKDNNPTKITIFTEHIKGQKRLIRRKKEKNINSKKRLI